jgi:RecA/RadA recombinase
MALSRKKLKKTVKEMNDSVEMESEHTEEISSGNFDYCVSTGSTLLDLAISGGRVRGGGIPGGIVAEIFGPESIGKSALLCEILASCTVRGGNQRLLDPEATLDRDYYEIYGVKLKKDEYYRPDYVTEVFDLVQKWKPDPAPKGSCNILGADSLAALSSKTEMREEGDKMAGRRLAQDFSSGFRKTCRLIKHENFSVICTNQMRSSDAGETTPGGFAIRYYSSLRIRLGIPARDKHVKKVVKFNGIDQEKVIGIKVNAQIKKSKLDEPYRKADLYIIFGYGIHDIMGNIQWLKDVQKLNKYPAVDQEFGWRDTAIKHIEDNNLEMQLREQVIDLWQKLQKEFHIERKTKIRI